MKKRKGLIKVMKLEGCQLCGCKYITGEDDGIHTKCNDCGWIYDPEIKDDNEYSKYNKMSLKEYSEKVNKYPIIKDFFGEYKLVSTINPENIPLAFHHDLHGSQGCWGVIDKNWNEVIEPKYLFPLMQFNNGTFLACKGTGWIKDNEWDEAQINEEGKGRYWTKEEKWGLIDFKEKEIIPCIYDEIHCINNDYYNENIENLFAVYRHQYKPYEIQEVAVMNNKGEIIIPFKYNDVYWYENEKQLIVYTNGTRYDSEGLVGVYDLKLNREIIAPQYKDIDYLDYNLFIISDDPEYSRNATIINSNNEIIGEEKNWKSLYKESDEGKYIYKGETMDGKCYKFNIVGKEIVDRIEVESKD